ncbi:MAG TPA: PadR family transcriptional regulator [Solirubrobacterales bacterium]
MLDDPYAQWYGLELAKASGLKPGTIYPALARLESAGWLSSYWEDVDPSEAGRPRRRLYRLTGEGADSARVIVDQHLQRLAGSRERAGRLGLRPEGRTAI